MIQVYSLRWAPPIVRGYVRDIRVRWALEELGLAYENPKVGFSRNAAEDYLAIHPFGQVPGYAEGDLKLWESGGIVHHIALKSEKLMPSAPDEQARVTAWMFAALNSVEPFIQDWMFGVLFDSENKWAGARPWIIDLVELRLDQLTKELGDREYLTDRFTAADILMSTALNFLREDDLILKRPVVAAYRARCLARPAFAKALADHLSSFDESFAPAS